MVAEIGEKYSGPIIFIVGETATGKTDLGIHIAKKYDGEIVSADSWVVRRGVDIGTAKPSKQQLRDVKHHMVDIISPEEPFSAARYKVEAEKAVNTIARNGKLPIIVGGTGLYIDSLLYDFSFLPPASPGVRETLNAKSLDELIEIAGSTGLPLDTIDTRNKRRVIRLIETNGQVAARKPMRQNSLLIGISIDSEELKDRVSHRVDKMLKEGLVDEVEELYLKYGWDCEALKGIGYSEWRLYFESNQTLETTRQRIIKDTIQLAKRQKTWFKRNKSIHWIHTPVNFDHVEDKVTTFLNKTAC